MKDRFRQIIENADKSNFRPEIVALNESELVSASEKCEALAVEMMERFAEWTIPRYYPSLTIPLTTWTRGVDGATFTTRELVAKFLSENATPNK
jgi:hypothetical protein